MVSGLLVGTLGVAGYKHAISELRGLIEGAGKACYIFLVGKPSPAKLANFPEIEVWTQISSLLHQHVLQHWGRPALRLWSCVDIQTIAVDVTQN